MNRREFFGAVGMFLTQFSAQAQNPVAPPKPSETNAAIEEITKRLTKVYKDDPNSLTDDPEIKEIVKDVHGRLVRAIHMGLEENIKKIRPDNQQKPIPLSVAEFPLPLALSVE